MIAYLDHAHRWNWGVVAGQVPYYSGGFLSTSGSVQGEPARIDQTFIDRETERSAVGVGGDRRFSRLPAATVLLLSSAAARGSHTTNSLPFSAPILAAVNRP